MISQLRNFYFRNEVVHKSTFLSLFKKILCNANRDNEKMIKFTWVLFESTGFGVRFGFELQIKVGESEFAPVPGSVIRLTENKQKTRVLNLGLRQNFRTNESKVNNYIQ